MYLSNRLQNISKTKVPYILTLLVVFLAIVITNFPKDSWYTGWDNLHPELGFWINIKRSLFAAWQENQGLGLVSGHGFAANLLHSLFLQILSIAIPLQNLRATFTFLMLLTGSIGAFSLTEYILKERDKTLRYMASFAASLFYMLNFATVQNFYVQLEAFIIHFALLPWLFLSLFQFLENGSKKQLIIFGIVSLLSTPQGFIPQLFLVYIIYLLIILLSSALKSKTKENFKKCLVVLLTTFIINAFWLLPFTYYTVTNSHVYLNSYNNIQTTEDFELKNKKFGNIENVALLKGFLYEGIDTIQSGKIFYIFQEWQDHLKIPIIPIIGYSHFIVIVIGFLYLFTKAGGEFRVPLILISLLAFSILASNTQPFSHLSELFQKIPILKQAFRASFTKFSVSLSLFYALLFGIGLFSIASKLLNLELKKDAVNATASFIITLSLTSIIIFALPTFRGNFLYNRTKINIPSNYLELFKFFSKENPNARIANLPQGWNWGWSIYKWGYSGSGFLWYGTGQPILDRTFDVWSNYNENYYWEVSRAIYSVNFKQLESIFEKYQVQWIIFDENLSPYQNTKSFNYTEKIKENLNRSPKFILVKKFTTNNITAKPINVYKVNLSTPINNYLFVAENLPKVGPVYTWNNLDLAYIQKGNYVTEASNKYFYPFRSLFTGRQQEEILFKIEEERDFFKFKTEIPKEFYGSKIVVPEIEQAEYTEIDENILSKKTVQKPQVLIDQDTLEVIFPKIMGFYSYDSSKTEILFKQKPKVCNEFNQGFQKIEPIQNNDNKTLKLTSISSNNCVDIDLPNFEQRNGYLIKVESKNIKGKSLLFAIINKSSQKADLETYLPKDNNSNTNYFIQPPMQKDGLGYSLHFDNISIGNSETINELGKITVNQIPYNFLTNIKLVKDEGEIQTETYSINSTHPNPSLYEIPISELKIGESTIVLSQSYHQGWNAYKLNSKIPSLLAPILGEAIKDHVLVNNWENGWGIERGLLDQNNKIVIFFLPQLLEYLGFLLLPLTFLLIVLRRD